MEVGSKVKEGEEIVAQIWKAAALRGTVAIAFGVVLPP